MAGIGLWCRSMEFNEQTSIDVVVTRKQNRIVLYADIKILIEIRKL